MAERIPRASISVRFFGDEDTMAMFARGPIGERAVLMFIQLLTLAKELKNGGTFNHPIEVYAVRLFTTPQVARECFSILSEPSFAWLVERDGGFVVRSYDKYNDAPVAGWGGKRPGSGRPNKAKNHLDNQDENRFEIKKNQDGYTSVSVSSSVTNTSSPPPHARSDLVDHVCGVIAKAMNLTALRPTANEPQTVQRAIERWRTLGPATVRGSPVEPDAMILAATKCLAESGKRGGPLVGYVKWISTVIDTSYRDGTMPGERLDDERTQSDRAGAFGAERNGSAGYGRSTRTDRGSAAASARRTREADGDCG